MEGRGEVLCPRKKKEKSEPMIMIVGHCCQYYSSSSGLSSRKLEPGICAVCDIYYSALLRADIVVIHTL